MYAVTLNKLKAILKVTVQERRSGAVNKNSVESMTQDDFQEVKKRKRHIFNNISQRTKKSTKPVSISAAIKMPLKEC
jgi:hypothetical protein